MAEGGKVLDMSCKDSLIVEHIATITGMGFTDTESIKKSLQLASSDVNNAVAILTGELKADSLLEEHIATITGMGFADIESIKKALKHANNDINKAVAILTGKKTSISSASSTSGRYIPPHMRKNKNNVCPQLAIHPPETTRRRKDNSTGSDKQVVNERRSDQVNDWRNENRKKQLDNENVDNSPGPDKVNERRSDHVNDWRNENRDNDNENASMFVNFNNLRKKEKVTKNEDEDDDEDYLNIPELPFDTQAMRGRNLPTATVIHQGLGGHGREASGGGRKRRSIPIDQMRLERWNKYNSADDLTTEIYGKKDEILSLLNNTTMEEAVVLQLLEIFSKVTRCSRRHTMISVLAFLRDSLYMLKHVPQNIDYLMRRNDNDNTVSFSECLIQIISEYFLCFPRSYTDMPIDKLATLVDRIVDNQSLQQKVDILCKQKEELLRSSIERNIKISQINDAPPPNNFRDMGTFPTLDEIHAKEKPYLRPILKVGSYNDQEHYLDVQYRLLKEDLVSPLRDGIREIVNDVTKRMQKISLNTYYGIKLRHANCTSNGFTYKIMFDTKNMIGIPWEQSRRLIYGSLVCLSNDKFQTMIFAIISDRKPEYLQFGFVDIRFQDAAVAKEYFRVKSEMIMVECPSYFEAYRHVLDAMKQITDVPFPQYIIYYNDETMPPLYLRNKSDIMYDLSNISTKRLPKETKSTFIPNRIPGTRILKENEWPVFTDTNLNQSQLKAFMNAITSEFSVIQGPPGTGKTHVALRIADALLRNKNYWNDENTVPLLVVCYTNHALDQFLMGLIELGHRKIIRVGGRSSSELDEYNLRKHTHECTGNEHTREAKRSAYVTRDEIASQISPYVARLEALDDTFISGKLLHYNLLVHVISPEHSAYFNIFIKKCEELRISVFDIFLSLLHITPQNVWGMQMGVQPQHEGAYTMDHDNTSGNTGGETIAIDGEGAMLVERWGGNVNDYTRNKKINYIREETPYNGNTFFMDRDGFQTVQPSKYDKKRKIKQNLSTSVKMSHEEAMRVSDPWKLDLGRRWELYMYWVDKYIAKNTEYVEEVVETYDNACQTLKEIHDQESEIVLKRHDIVAMTTTCAAKCRASLSNIKPKIVIIEEAAEVLEAHLITSLSEGLEHLILIGDHKQLKPNPSVYELAKKYSLDVSLFERMVNNGMQCHTLNIQHRMRPEISSLVRHIYPDLLNHESVLNYPNVKGLQNNVLFINHSCTEEQAEHLRSKSNMHEAEFLKCLCRYLIQQGYQSKQITILTGYTGQLTTIKRIMPRSEFEGVRVTSVDNFQGEENDIILLSLVRSNLDGNIGFLKTENRICVALSRAKVGLFVIGNFDLLEKESPHWKKIINDMRNSDSIKDHLALQCQNHPATVVQIRNGNDFSCAPEGGCTKPCEFRLDCGHACQMACHPYDMQHEKYVCKRKCGRKTCSLDHRCPSICHHGGDCNPCPTMMQKSIPLCGHIQSMKCCDKPSEFACKEKCSSIRTCGHNCTRECWETCDLFECNVLTTKKIEACGHNQNIICSEDMELIKCKSPCNSQLDCLHQCAGTCGSCNQGRLHDKCLHPCNRLLVCSHLCLETCISECPPCKRKCENSCVHSQCQKMCGEACTPCTEPCQWRCEHFVCHMQCSQTCDRERCNMPCLKVLECGHKCIGLCGEICPSLCRICHRDLVEEIFFGTEGEDNARFIVLTDCEHMFESTALDQFMAMDVGEGRIKLKECPRCKTPVRKSLRYGNIIKAVLSDINEVKQIMIDSMAGIKKLRSVGYKECKEIWRRMHEYTWRIPDFPDEHKLQEIKHLETYSNSKELCIRMVVTLYSASNLSEATRYLNLVYTWKKAMSLKFTIERFRGSKEKLLMLLDRLIFYLTERLTVQQCQQGTVELQRLYLLYNVYEVQHSLDGMTVLEKEEKEDDFKKGKTDVNNLLEFLQSGRPISIDNINTKMHFLEEFQKKNGFGALTAADKAMIIKAIGLGKGHWFKCKRGHCYAIGDCGGATVEGICPECKCQIGGVNHTLTEGNQHAGEFDDSENAAYSEEANNMMNYDEIRRLVLE